MLGYVFIYARRLPSSFLPNFLKSGDIGLYMAILVTGAAGFIGFHVSQALLQRGETVIGLDVLNHYYDVRLKETRLQMLKKYPQFSFVKLDIAHVTEMQEFFQKHPEIDQVVHLAAQAGVRYSLTHPFAYADTNMVGHLAILEGCRHLPSLKHLVYASSSSVYGSNTKLPFAVEDRTDHPISLYAATKKSCELMSDCYSHLYRLPITGMRYFTVYGPWGRPDMSAFLFTKAILEDKEITVFNHGNMRRNFTYIDDIVKGTLGCLNNPPKDDGKALPHRVYNLGNNRSESLMDFIGVIEKIIGKTAAKKFEDMQPGDVPETLADVTAAEQDFGFKPSTNIQDGLQNFIAWYRSYYEV
jgi:UDP-glucuronate 4-epimerase